MNLSTALSNYLQNNPLLGDILYRSISTSGLGVSIPSMENFDWTTQSIPNGFGENVNLYDYLLESGILSQNAISQYNLKLQDENYNYTSAAMPILAETLYSNTYTDEQKKIIDFNVAKQLGSQVKQFQTVADYQITDAMEYLNTGGDFFAGIPNIQDYKDKNNQFDISKDKAGNFIIKSQIKGVEDFILTQAQIAAKKVLVDEESIDVEELISRELKRFSNLQEIEQNYILGQSLNKKQLDSLTEDNIANINSFTGYNLTLENVLATWQKGWIEDLTIAQNKMIDALGPGLTEQVRENWGSVFTDENMDLSSMDVDFFKQYEYRTGGASQYLDFIDQIPKLIEAYDVIQKGEELSQEAYDTLVKFTTLTQKDFDITANGFKYIGEASNTFLTDSIINLQKVEKLVNDLTETEKTLTRDKENHNITGNLTLLKYLGYDFEDIFQLSDENFASLQQQYSSLVNGQMALVMSDAGKDAWMSTIKSWEQFGDTGLQWADISTSSQQMVLSNIAEQEGYDFKDLSAYGDVSNKTTYDRAKSAMLAEEAVIDFWANQEELFADNAKGLKALLEQKEENLDKESREQLLKAKTILANLFGVEVEAINMEWIKSIDWASLMSDEAINVQTALTNKVPDNANAVRTAVQMTSRNSLDLFERPRQTADKFSAELGFQGVRFAEIERLQDAIKGSGKEITEFLMEAYADEINAAGGDADLFAESKGFINFEEYATAFSNALELGGHFIAAGLDSSVRTIYNELYKKIGATISDEEELFANFLSTAYQEGGEAGLYNAKAIIEKWGVNASTELKKLAQLDIDWKNMSIEEIIEMAQAANIDVSGLESTIQALADSARAAIAPLQTITDIFGKFDTTNSLIDKSYAGEALTSEEIEAYKKLNPNWTPEDFIYNADGTATLTASAMAPETIAQAYVDSLNDTAEEMGTKAEGLQKWDADEEWTEEDKSAIDSIAQMLLAQGLISEGSEEATTLAQFGTATTAEGINAAGMDVQKALNDLGFSDMMALSTEAERFYADQAEAGKEAAADAQNTFSKPLMQADDFGLVRDEIDELGDSIQKMAKQSDELADSLESDAIAADEVAKEIKRYNKAIDSISNSYDDWMDALDSENIEKQSKALNEMDQAMSDMLDIDYGSLDEQFLIDNASLMKDAANGVEGAYEELQAKAEDQLILQAGVDINDEEAWAKINSLQDTIHNSIDDIQIGATIDNAGAIAAMNELINMAGMTATEATNYLSNMGVDANVKEVTVPQSSLVTGYKATVTNQPAFNAAGESINVSSVTYDAVPTMVDGEVTVPALEVTSATKSSGGNFKYANSSRPSRRGGGGGGRGGGGSRRPTAEKKENKSKERYHTITNQLEDLTDAYEKVSTAADRAFGKSKIKLIQDQEKALQSLIGKERDHLDEVNKYYESDKANLDKVSQYVGFDVQLDENGSIINFDDIQDKMFAEYNKHINKKGEVTDMDEEAWKEYEKEWQDIMDLISQYEETQDLKKEVEKQIQDYVNELYDLQLSEITYKVDVQIEVSEDALGILDYMLNKINDDAWQAAEVIAVMGQRTGELLDQNDTYTKGITDILMKHTKNITDDEGNIIKKAKLTEEDINGFLSGDPEAFKKLVGMNDEFTAEEVESLRGYYNALIENNNALMEEQRAIFQTALDAFNAYTEELDRSIEKIDHLANLTEHYGNIVDIVGKKNLGISNALMESIGQASVDEAINRVEATRTKMLQLEEEVAKAQAARDEAAAKGWEEDVKLWDKNLKEMNDALDAAEEDFMQSWEDALTSISEKFDAAVERAITTLSDSLAGPLLGSLEELQEMFDRQDMVAERFLPDYEKIYELNKLNRDIQNSMDDTDNIKGKQELAKLQEEINKLEEDGVEVSQYQIENLRRRYELKLAELALNEAQNAKSEVRMSRNADGDWSYVYTASEEDVAEAEQNYEDKLFAIQEANAEYINNLQDMMVQMQEEMSSKIEEIMTDETLSMEERMAKVNETTAFYQEQMGYYKDQLSLVLSENQLIYEDDWAKYSEATGYKISADELYLDHFDELKLSMLTGYEDLEALQQAFNDAIGSPDSGGLLYELDNAYQTWKLNTEEAFEAAGTSMDGYKDLMEEDVAAIIDASEEATEAIEDMSNNIDVAFNKMLDSLSNWQSQYSQVIQDMLDKNTLLAESFNKLLKEWTNFEDSQLEDEEPTDDEPEKEPEDDNGGDDPANEEKGGTVHYDAGTRYWMYTDKGKKSGTVHGERTVNWTIKKGNKLYVPELGKWVSDETVGSDYDKKHRKVTYFDTGGYTGEWGNEGRWAMLHEKEIILNKNDTSNLLSAIGIIRDISKAIDLNAYASAGFGTSIRSPWLDGNKQELQQHVEITAEFPNATDKNEILEAFNNVIDLASQYANRK